jgi:hypothetical protein
VPNAPSVTTSGGISTPKLFGYAHLSAELTYIGERATRPDANTGDVLYSPGWVGLNGVIYVPNISGFDFTAGVRNILGTRDLVVAPGDYDRYDMTTMTTTTIQQLPGEGREVFAKVGYAY